MKRSCIRTAGLACTLLASAGSALAQSSVTIYGIADAAVRYDRNSTNVATDSKTQMVSGGSAGSRLGFRGTEDLGGGLKAVFQLEMGLSLEDGSLKQGQAFGRQSWVGLEGDWGRLTMGRQYNALNSLWNNFNPLDDQWGSYWADPYYIGGDRFFQSYRYNRSLVYANAVGPLKVQLDYASSDGTGPNSHGGSVGGSLTYASGAVSVGAAVARQRPDAGGAGKLDWTLGAKYAFDGGHYLSGGVMSTRQRDNGARYEIAFAGGGWRPTPLLLLSGALYHFRQTATTAAGAGDANAFAFVGDYALSKRTNLYLQYDRTLAKDGAARSTTAYWGNSPDNVTTLGRTGVMAGIRHRF